MEKIFKHLKKLGYDEDGRASIKVINYLKRKHKEIFKTKAAIDSSDTIILKLKNHFNKDKMLESNEIFLSETFPSVDEYWVAYSNLYFTLSQGSFVRFSNTKYEDVMLKKLTWSRFLSGENFKSDSFEKIIEAHHEEESGYFGGYINIFNIKEPVTCMLTATGIWSDGIPGIFDQEYIYSSKLMNNFLIARKIDIVVFREEVIFNSNSLSKFNIDRYMFNDEFLLNEYYNKYSASEEEYKNYLLGVSELSTRIDVSKICRQSASTNLSMRDFLEQKVFIKY